MSSGTFSLMPGPANPALDAATYGGTQTAGFLTPGTTLISQLALDVASTIKDCPIPIVNLAYTRAAREFTRRSFFLKRNVTNAALTINQPVYNFSGDASLEVIGINAAAVQQQNATWVDLRPADATMYDPNMITDLPTWYSYIPEGMIQFYPTPNYAFLTNVEIVVQTSINATTIPNDLVSRWNTYIEAGALQFLFEMNSQPWSDPVAAARNAELFQEGVGMARSWRDRGYQKGSVRATPRPFLAR